MSQYAAASSYTKQQFLGSCVIDRVSAPGGSRNRILKRGCGGLKVVSLSSPKHCKLETSDFANFKLSSGPIKSTLKCSCLASLVDPEGAPVSDLVPFVNQVLLMTSIFLTYMAGVIPSEKVFSNSGKTKTDEAWIPEGSRASGSVEKNDGQVNLKFAWDVVKKKLLDSLNAIEQRRKSGDRVAEFEHINAKRPLSLYAVAEGPRLRLLWDSLELLREEVNSISGSNENINTLETFADIIQRSCMSICTGWLEKEYILNSIKPNEVLLSTMYEKLKGDGNILQKIRKSGKEDLYSEWLYFLRFGSRGKAKCYDYTLYTIHGVSILEDLVITLADGIASTYLELISVDGNMSNESNSMCSVLCALSTRELQKLRNEVSLYQWLHMNMEAVVSMYEDRFDLSTLQTQLIEDPGKTQTDKFGWWKNITMRRSGFVPSTLSYITISHFPMAVKRTKELRVLVGWRYYYSLFLELSDITMPLIRVVFEKISSAITFFLVTLIGRSLGLIYTGIRQSLRWR